MRHVLDTLFADESGTYMQRIAAQPHIYQYVRLYRQFHQCWGGSVAGAETAWLCPRDCCLLPRVCWWGVWLPAPPWSVTRLATPKAMCHHPASSQPDLPAVPPCLQVRQRLSQYEDQLRPQTEEEAAAEAAARKKPRRKSSRTASPA